MYGTKEKTILQWNKQYYIPMYFFPRESGDLGNRLLQMKVMATAYLHFLCKLCVPETKDYVPMGLSNTTEPRLQNAIGHKTFLRFFSVLKNVSTSLIV